MAERRSDGLYMLTLALLCALCTVLGFSAGSLVTQRLLRQRQYAVVDRDAQDLRLCRQACRTSEHIVRSVFREWEPSEFCLDGKGDGEP